MMEHTNWKTAFETVPVSAISPATEAAIERGSDMYVEELRDFRMRVMRVREEHRDIKV